MTMHHCCFTSPLILLAVAAASSCRDTPLAADVNTNVAPVANAGTMQTLDYSGSPVAVKLDGSQSKDPDGTIVTYRWLSAVAADSGVGRDGPDPDDVVSPTVMLDAGVWDFTLFVIDNDGGVSEPSNVTIQVGSTSTVPPEVTECAGDSLQTISEDCRLCLCGVSEMCRTATTKCTGDCWNLLFCVDNKCAGIDPGDMSAYVNCVTGMCGAFLEGGLLSQSLTPCRNTAPCSELCSASAQGM